LSLLKLEVRNCSGIVSGTLDTALINTDLLIMRDNLIMLSVSLKSGKYGNCQELQKRKL